MDPSKGSIYDLLNGTNQYIVPAYQRKYSWKKDVQCKRLWNDIIKMVRENKRNHFVGSIVNIKESNGPIGVQKYLVIDGQQRMTTLTLLLIAMRDFLKAKGEDGSEDINDAYILNLKKKGEDKYKLLLGDYDKEILIKLIDGLPLLDKDKESLLFENYVFFKSCFENTDLEVNDIYTAIGKLIIVNITLVKEDGDNPQLIFETLNSTGMDLSQSDLIRNYILMGLDNDEQHMLYSSFWQPMEDFFPVQDRSYIMDLFFRDYLTMENGAIPKQEDIYEKFKEYSTNSSFSTAKELAENLHFYALCYCELNHRDISDTEIQSRFNSIRHIRMLVANPFLMRVYGHYKRNKISKQEFLELLDLTISYVVRRAICDIPTNSLNKTFSSLFRQIDQACFFDSFKYILFSLNEYKRFPDDNEFKKILLIKDLYGTKNCHFFLVSLENYQNKEKIGMDGYTIEHIMPQNKALNMDWQDALGPNWQDVHSTYLHTLGNLTLTRYNSELSDDSFTDKKEYYKESAMHTLNKYVVEQDTWNEPKIKNRAKILSEIACNVFPYPIVSKDIIDKYAEKPDLAKQLSWQDYNIDNAHVEILWKTLECEILKTEPNIKREFKKKYIAYKLKTNVVDIVPQKSALRISVNLRFDEVNDPKNICKDVTDIGRWGNGDVEIHFDSLSMLEDAMYIIKQSMIKHKNS